jgi:hypothetical protein
VHALAGDQVLCGVDTIDVPESSAAGVVTDWIHPGETLTVTPQAGFTIWAGVWFTGTNGPAGWPGTVAPSYYPLPGAPEYSLIGRLGNGGYQYVGADAVRFTDPAGSGLDMRARFRTNDNTPGNGSGAFRVFVQYPCRAA